METTNVNNQKTLKQRVAEVKIIFYLLLAFIIICSVDGMSLGMLCIMLPISLFCFIRCGKLSEDLPTENID